LFRQLKMPKPPTRRSNHFATHAEQTLPIAGPADSTGHRCVAFTGMPHITL
jgi:hypothetical protein